MKNNRACMKEAVEAVSRMLLAIVLFSGLAFAVAPVTTATLVDGLGTPWPCTAGSWCKSIPSAPVGLYVNLTCSGTCTATYYCEDATNTCTPNINYNLAGPFQSGTAYVRYYSTGTGGTEAVTSIAVKIDTALPVTGASAVRADGTKYPFNTSTSLYVNLTLSCRDEGSGCSSTVYCTDIANACTPATSYSTPIRIPTAGTSYIRYKSTDVAGNAEAVRSQIIQIGAAPATTATAVKSTGVAYQFNTWTGSPYVNVTLSRAGLGTTKYCVSLSGPCTPALPYSTPVNVKAAIPAYISYASTGNTGLNEPVTTQLINFDATAPATYTGAVKSDGASYAFSTWTPSSYVNVTLACTDAGVPSSGCNVTLYCLDAANACAPSLPYSAPVQVSTPGISYVRYSSNDTAGNVGLTASKTIMLGGVVGGGTPVTTATAVKSSGLPYIFSTWTSSPYVNVTLSCTDVGGPGCGTTLYCTDATNTCAPAAVYPAPVQISTAGISYTRFSSNDTLGVREANRSQVVMIDTAAPITSAVATAGGVAYLFGTTVNQSVTVTLACADALSGCASTYYCIDTVNFCNPSAGGLIYPPAGITMSSTGYVRYQSLDVAGNLEAAGSGSVVIAAANVSTPIYVGWNLIGWASPIPTTAQAFGTLVGGDNVATYSALTQQWLSSVFVPGIGWLGTNFAIGQGGAVFVHSAVNSTWVH